MSPFQQLALLVIISAVGFFIAYLYNRREKRFRWSAFVLAVIIPIATILLSYPVYHIGIVNFYLASCVAGFILEFSVGWIYEKIFGEKVWTYHLYSVGGYTSWLSLPVWGGIGVIFWLIARSIGL